MATYVIGDVQGCFAELEQLVGKLRLEKTDRLWFVGDLVNRGPGSLETLRYVQGLGDNGQTVLGNHDLHFLAIYFGGHSPKRGDTFNELLAAHDVDDLAHWLRCQPLIHRDEALGVTMVHAGIPPFWSSARACELAAEVESVLCDGKYKKFLRNLYGNEPDVWSDRLSGHDRLKVITNYLTRLRFIDERGGMDFKFKEGLSGVPDNLTPWFDEYSKAHPDESVVFGHWASIQGVTGIYNIHATDTGCVWGRELTALCLETGERFSVEAH